ncbi:MAG: PQQ-binding-like beta-propeller repeat protein [bacterium]
MKRSLRLLFVLHLALAGTAGFGADWPQWRGLNRDGKSPETGLLKEWPAEGLEPVWVAEGLGEGYSTVAVVDGTIYTTGMVKETHEGVLFAFDLAGNLKWRIPYGPVWQGKHAGTRSTPTIDGDRIYVLTGTGRLVCFDVKRRAVQWSVDVAKTFGGEAPVMGFAESILVYENKVICTPGGKDASLVALDKTNGKTIWTTKGFSEQSAYCSPILIERGGNRLIVTITAKSVVGINPNTGDLVWSRPQDPDAQDPNHSITPAYEDGCIYVTSGHGEGGQMLELSPDGQQISQKWVDTTLNTLHGGAVLVDGYIYGTSSKGKWVCLDLKNGEVMYEVMGVGMGSVAYADGMLYCYGETGTLGLVKATPEGYELSGEVRVKHGKGPHWPHPVISGGRLYIRHRDALMAYDIQAE